MIEHKAGVPALATAILKMSRAAKWSKAGSGMAIHYGQADAFYKSAVPNTPIVISHGGSVGPKSEP